MGHLAHSRVRGPFAKQMVSLGTMRRLGKTRHHLIKVSQASSLREWQIGHSSIAREN